MRGKVLPISSARGKAKSAIQDHPARCAGMVGDEPERLKIAKLTRRELEVIALAGEGLKNAEIAERLYISPTTVRHHLSSVFMKLDVPDRLKLIVYAYRHGLADLPK